VKIKSKDITVCAVAVALMFVLAWLPVAAFMIPVVFVACSYRPKYGLIVGIFAGCTCLLWALMFGAASESPVNIAIICAVWIVPRGVAGWLSALAFAGVRKFRGRVPGVGGREIDGAMDGGKAAGGKSGGKTARWLPYNAAASAGVVTNTALVVSCLVWLFPGMEIMGLPVGAFWWAFVLIGLGELLVLNLIMPPLCLAVGKALKLGEFERMKNEKRKTKNDGGGFSDEKLGHESP